MKTLVYTITAIALWLSSSIAIAQDDKLDDVLELLLEMRQEQQALREEVDRLKAAQVDENPTSATQDVAPTQKKKKKKSAVLKPGLKASVHPTDGYSSEPSPMLGRMVISGFPMPHDISSGKFDISNQVLYKSKGILRIEEAGEYTFILNLRHANREFYTVCRFWVGVEGNRLIDVAKGRVVRDESKSWTGAVELEENAYQFEMLQTCGANDTVTWDLQVITPDADDPVSINEFLYYRAKAN